jgi:hypothetical protein
MTGKPDDKQPEKKLSYMEALGMFQRAIKEITPEDVADAIHEQYDAAKVMEIQQTLFLMRKNQLEEKLVRAKQIEAIEKPPQKKGGRK